ncbi:MAG: beta-galactosidase [Candidatus Hydrogenedentes bacterium]|nr:beta-galactosidase [Candidatus Hydrogenedentota bacterium]
MKSVTLIALAALLLVPVLAGAAEQAPVFVLESFDSPSLPETVVLNDVKARLVRRDGGRALDVRFPKSERPGVRFAPRQGVWDWSPYEGVAIDIHNPGREPVQVFLRVDSRAPDGKRLVGRCQRVLPPKQTTTAQLLFTNGGAGQFDGLRAIPFYGIVSKHGSSIGGFAIEFPAITALNIYQNRPERKSRLIIDNIRLFPPGHVLGQVVPFPFVDRFGQLIPKEWPGKIHDEAELAACLEQEHAALSAAPQLPGRDELGGWADGPQLEATGWFRTERVDGKWWLVTPKGHLFFSVGMNCVRTGDSTRVAGREHWFAWVPESAENVSFHRENLARKIGGDWRDPWRDLVYARLKSWGYNTIGNWSDRAIIDASPIPHTASAVVHDVCRRIEGSEGFWGKMADVYDPDFVPKVDGRVAQLVAPFADKPLCIGYFIDNEIAWESIAPGTLASPPEQPARIVLIERLKQKYPSIAELNKAWDTDAAGWDELRAPAAPNAVCTADTDAFVYAFARHYFETMAAALHKHAPNQLYLGCRFQMIAPDPVVRACAENVDVVSFNRYSRFMRPEEWSGENDLGKPILVGEYHFGSDDRNMFHPGIVAAPTQAERAEGFMEFVRSVVDCPAFVGCHWFQFIDQPITGRTGDGENFNVGFVDVCDNPYPEMVDAARTVYSEVYERRFGAPAR